MLQGQKVVLSLYRPSTTSFCGRALPSCHSLQSCRRDALHLLDEMPPPDFRTCNERIRYCTSNHDHQASLALFRWMLGARLRPDSFALAAVIKSATASLLVTGQPEAVHGFALKAGYAAFAAVQKTIIDMYARFGALGDSCRVFGEMDKRDSVAWNVLLTGYIRAGLHKDAMSLFCSMHACGVEEVKPTAITFAVILPLISKLNLLKNGQNVHGYAIKLGLEAGTLVGNALVSMYAKCDSVVDDAHKVFSLISSKDVVSWNSLIAGCSQCGLFAEAFKLFSQMVSTDLLPNETTIVSILPICAFMEDGWHSGKEFHCYILRHGLDMDLSVWNALLMHYSKVGHMERAECIFSRLDMPDLVTWNSMIAGYATNGWISKALDLFQLLLFSGIKPDSVTLVSVLPLCAQHHDLNGGKKIHGYVFRHNLLCQETSLENTIVDLYGKCGKLEDALQTFKSIKKKDIVSWNTMLSAYVDNERVEKFVNLLNQMNHQGIQPDCITILTVLRATILYGIRKVREAHAYSFRCGFVSHTNVGNAILDAYAKCGSTEDAQRTFSNLTGKNVITGNTMISGYLKNGCLDSAKMVFRQMFEKDNTTWNLMVKVYAHSDRRDLAFVLFHHLQSEGMRPDSLSIMSILPACACLASPHLVRQCHGYVIRNYLYDTHLEGALLDSYAKCGSIIDAYKLFQTSPSRDLVTFTAMVGGYAMHGLADEAIRVFSDMLEANVKPDHVIMTALLSACGHAGLTDEGWRLFKSMIQLHDIRPTMEHYACMVDLLARRGRLREAYEFILNLPCEANANVWGTLLGACKIHKEVEIGRLVADKLFHIEAENIGNYVVMSNIYAADGRWEGVEQVRRLMKEKDLKKPAGCSWLEVGLKRHVFVAGDLSHPQRTIIYGTLITLDKLMKESLKSTSI
ncbi:pentatricopeptide repeat-containing protein [Canna indica]|uniref:Pentatricopeptide repeat-containing protein n=1 Tax=Canna indica TaxID=4628 RepID=A0AAQ3KZP4_9LILI|nr:pentatricopeptide repeat-containing protein [Canna indica]